MAHFYGEISGSTRTTGTRCGTKLSGIRSHIRSWDKGVEVYCEYDKYSNRNIFRIYMTGGSNNPSSRRLITEVSEEL